MSKELASLGAWMQEVEDRLKELEAAKGLFELAKDRRAMGFNSFSEAKIRLEAEKEQEVAKNQISAFAESLVREQEQFGRQAENENKLLAQIQRMGEEIAKLQKEREDARAIADGWFQKVRMTHHLGNTPGLWIPNDMNSVTTGD